jgi:hypothetical protein
MVVVVVTAGVERARDALSHLDPTPEILSKPLDYGHLLETVERGLSVLTAPARARTPCSGWPS